ncbi:hypothetical protein DFH07DRAFT_970617 [Mycena maculata]|uniref:Uncharacterized protein n=1 Tax=Mycena maculata TaxID=230809 RepID=A0AAD7HQZ5_9AGAR|nr:hypothetical protein DFH07DRAFT_970617 [Mycena maculata]
MKLTVAVSIAVALVPVVRGMAVETNDLTVPFAINIGNDTSTGNTVAWVAGDLQCQTVTIAPIGTNFSNPAPFTLSGEIFTAYTRDGSFSVNETINEINTYYANCTSLSEEDECAIPIEWQCP